jgi:hypothetical protein
MTKTSGEVPKVTELAVHRSSIAVYSPARWYWREVPMANPYTEEPYKTAWDHGHDHGVANPSDTEPTPPDYSSWGYDETTTGYIATVWREGALAGREEGDGGHSGGGVSIDVPDCAADSGAGAWSYTDEELMALYQEGLPANVEGVNFGWEPPAAETGEAETGESETSGEQTEEPSEEEREHA